MDNLLDPMQATFVQGRSIVVNIHLAQELLRKYARKRISHIACLKWTFKRHLTRWIRVSCKQHLVVLVFPNSSVNGSMD